MDDLTTDIEPTFNFPLRELVTVRIVRLNAKLTAQAARILKKSAGLTPAQWRVMFMIHDNGAMSPAQIVRMIGMDKGQLSRTIKLMIDTGLLRSTSSASDQRSFELSLTEVGRAMFERAQPRMRRRQNRLMGTFTDSEREMLFSLLDRLEVTTDALEAEN